jgi:N-acetylglucosamine-6-phosphate deacetylase
MITPVPELLLSAGQVITPERVLAPGWLLIADGLLVDIGPDVPPRPPDVAFPESTVVPGFVDVHVHGGGGASFEGGDPDAAATAVRAHLARGTTTMVASLVSDELDSLTRSARELGNLVDDGLVAGVHLEGPWLSPRRAGAHELTRLSTPDDQSVDRVLAGAGEHLLMVTLAPELPGGLEAVRRLSAAGVVAAIGHTDATYDQCRSALDAGASVGTHLFNAMPGIHHREPGPVVALLEHPDAYVELVADGVHVHPAVLRMVMSTKPHLTTLVSDAMAAAEAGDGDYQLGSRAVEVRAGAARLAGSHALAGSTLTMAAAVRYVVQVVGMTLPGAVRAASSTPATMLGLDRVGSLRPGYHADLVVLDRDLDVLRVMQRGSWV